MDLEALIAKFTTTITGWTVAQLVQYYAKQSAVNTFGEKDRELAIIMAEIESRVS